MTRIEISGAGESVTLTDYAADFLRSQGGSGWGKAPVVNMWSEGAADGKRFRGKRSIARVLNLPVHVFGGTATVVNDRVRQLVRIFAGEAVLRVTQDDGRIFTIPVVYENGLEGDYDLGKQVAAFEGLTLSCPDPFWTSLDIETVEWVYAAGEPFLERRVLSSADLAGDRQVTNLGDVSARPSWTVQGPFSGFEALINGVGFEFTEALLVGETLTISFDGWGWTVTDDTGANRYAGIAWGSRFPLLPADASTVTLALAGADSGTRVSMSWAERREVVFA